MKVDFLYKVSSAVLCDDLFHTVTQGPKLTKSLLFYSLHHLGHVDFMLHNRRNKTGESDMGFSLPWCKNDICNFWSHFTG